MTEHIAKHDIFGIGSPLMDLLVQVDDTTISKLGLTKGSFILVDEERSKEIFSSLKKESLKVSFGDSTANTLSGASNLGLNNSYLGKTGNDEYADMFAGDLNKRGISSKIVKHDSLPTGTVLALITPDKERTFIVHLGAATTLSPDDLDENDIKNAKIFHTTGYQLENPNLRETVMKAVKIAKENNILISVDLADPGLIERNHTFLMEFAMEYADIIFVNESEAKAFTKLEDEEESLLHLQDYASTVCLKIGPRGSLITKDGLIHYIDAHTVDALDTTGAGDMYAAGILYGIARGLDMEKAGKLASLASAKVVSQIGARLDYPILELEEAKNILG